MSIFGKKKNRKFSAHASINYQGKLLSEKTPFAVTESFKTLRTNLLYTTGQDQCPVYGVTSTYQNSGKSLISANLAIAFSMLGKKVLLLDGDMRKPVQQRCFGLSNKKGTSELLSGLATIDEVVQSVPAYPSLNVITAGNIPPNPQELLAGENAGKCFKQLKGRYDLIIVDLPPASVVSDSIALSPLVTGFLYVIRSGEDDTVGVKHTIEFMEQMNCRVLGTVLNCVDMKSGKYYGKKGYQYYRRNGDQLEE